MLSDVLEGSGTKCTGTGSLATTSVLAVSVIVLPSDFDPSSERELYASGCPSFSVFVYEGSFSELSPLGRYFSTMVTVGRGAEASSDFCSRYNPIVVARYAMS
jgi:hypothetical protein